MTNVQLAVYLILWTGVAVLGTFVVLMYRELDRAYGRTQGPVQGGGLAEGAAVPPILVVGPGGTDELAIAEKPGPLLLAVVTTDCPACEQTMELLHSGANHDVPVLALVGGSGTKYSNLATDRLELHWLHNPADAGAKLLVTVVPTLYMLMDGLVVASTADGSSDGIRALVATAGSESETVLNAPGDDVRGWE